MNTPSVYQDHESNIVILSKTTPSTAYCIIIENCQRVVKAYKLLEFLKLYRQLDYDVYKAAEKMLYSLNIKCTQSATLELKGLLAMNTEKQTILVVSRTAEFIGKFYDAKTASTVTEDTSLIITSPKDFTDVFSKTQLVTNIAWTTENPEPNETKLKNITKQSLAEQLYAQYQNIEMIIPESTVKSSNKPKTNSAFTVLIEDFSNGIVHSISSIVDKFGCSKETAASMLSNMKSEKYMKDRPTIDIQSGYINRVKSYFISNARPENLDIKPERKTAMAKEKGEGKKGLKTIIRELLTEGPKTMDELIEATTASKKAISDQLAYLQNEKYAGKAGVIKIEKDAETKAYQIVA